MKEIKPKVFTNRLIDEKSPYLLQHAENPVNWYPWTDEAFQKAKDENKPVFLSIGYATCHWCHVMAHESFEDDEVASILNRSFISIKVDREERPDIDQVYMSVCQSLTGRGGWPLSVFLTPEGKPFFAGTYFPKETRMGMRGFIDILNQIAPLWEKDRERLIKAGEEITNAIQRNDIEEEGQTLHIETLQKSYELLARSFDPKWGGFGGAPKFPTPHQLTFLFRWHQRNPHSSALNMAEKTLNTMYHGGIFDQVGFGFHRYSVDERWLVPHFEKMLYDQALLAMAYTEAFQITKKDIYAKVTREIFEYVLRDMRDTTGGFYSAEDADSEGKEGLFYVWEPDQIKAHLGRDSGELFCRFYNITDSGNFEEGYSIPNVRIPLEVFAKKERIDIKELQATLELGRQKLFNVRDKRIHPQKDDKILTSWNGLMIAAFAKGFRVLGDEGYRDAAINAASFILDKLKTDNHRLFRRYRDGDIAYPGYIDDYAFLIWGLIELYESTFNISYLEESIALNETMLELFWDRAGGFFFTGKESERLIIRSKEIYDGAMPSGNSIAALNLLRLARITGNTELERKTDELVRAFSRDISQYPAGYSQFLQALDFIIGPSREIVISGDPHLKTTQNMISTIHNSFLPNKVILFHPGCNADKRLSKISPYVKELSNKDQGPTAYICEQYACNTPITDIDDLIKTLSQ